MTRITLTFLLVAGIYLGNHVAAQDTQQATAPEFKMRPIGHVKKSQDQTCIVLNKEFEPGLLGLDGYDDQFKAWLTEAEKVADGLGQAVLSGNLDQADRQFGTLMQSCKQCHAEYRN